MVIYILIIIKKKPAGHEEFNIPNQVNEKFTVEKKLF